MCNANTFLALQIHCCKHKFYACTDPTANNQYNYIFLFQVYMMSFENNNRPPMNRGVPPRRKPNTFSRKCCIPGFWNCTRPAPVVSEMYHRRTTPRSTPRPTSPSSPKRNSISTAVQTTNVDQHRLSKVSWNSEVDVRYIGSGIQSVEAQKAPLQQAKLKEKVNELKNVVHLKIKIPKDVLNLTNGEGHGPKLLENEWYQFNSMENGKVTAGNEKATQSVAQEQEHDLESQPCNRSPFPKNNQKSSNIGQKKLQAIKQNASGNAIVGSSIVHGRNEEHISSETVGIPIKQPGNTKCDSPGCTCKGAQTEDRLEKVRKSLDMTESELSVLEKTVHSPPEPVQLKIRTEYGSVNVISHDPDCKCGICETFGSHDEFRQKHRGCSDSAAVISKKVIRVHYNGNYRNVITHTEECGCEICCNIEEHSSVLKRASISTHQGELVVKNRGICGCQNCKTVEMGPHVVDVETILSRTSSDAFDRCYYSDVTAPSMQSFPREVLTTTDDQGASFSSPPSINSSDISDNLYNPIPLPSNANMSHERSIPDQNPTAEHNGRSYGVKSARKTNKRKSKCDHTETQLSTKSRKIYKFIKSSSAKSSPAGLNKYNIENECSHCKNSKEKVPKKREPIPTKSTFSTRTNLKPSKPQEISTADNKENSNNTEALSGNPNADKKISYTADYVTLEDLIKDLIRGQPEIQKDKVYTVTLGEVANKAYTKIHIVDWPPKSVEVNENETTTKLRKVAAKMPDGDGANSNVFFLNRTSQMNTSDSPNFRDNQYNNNNSLSSPACIGEPNFASFEQKDVNSISEVQQGIARSASDASPRSDVPKRAFKLTVRFGKRVVSFFKQQTKKKTSNHTLSEVTQDNPRCLKTFTIYEGAHEHFTPVELFRIDVKPRYFTQENNRGEEANNSVERSPILCLVEKNSSCTQVVATTAK